MAGSLFIVCGYVASGKTTVANALSVKADLEIIRTDDLRKKLFPKEFDFGGGAPPKAEEISLWLKNNPEADLQQVLNPLYSLGSAYTDIVSRYSSKMKEQKEKVYDQAFADLDNLLVSGKNVLFDATFSKVDMRNRAYQAAMKNGLKKVYLVQVVCEENIVNSRLAKRRSGEQSTSSNAKEMDVFRRIKKEFDASQIHEDAPDNISIARIVYDTGTHIIQKYGEEDEETERIEGVLSLLSQRYGGN
ncbi:MAG: AAA family ATPase [Candidatus Pacebacteria bacterium]|nr:AAA family ATPase [Candidatus Paceibacterota bacterium]MDD2757239.1 AAA family ATPase [Candidatus Paceibacterota bacterium]MDD3283785.1 AAA family ATPase [Candidatus Paceibacterota bacterium]MDD3969991.1 AAA family ATPase [Candidatus Paceibacterota bacterium]MDD4738046.1 AAA family ATPase [Candidatus Paceibacterota bacterium]